MVDGKYLFEVGGANKTFEQIKDVSDSFLAVDNTEQATGTAYRSGYLVSSIDSAIYQRSLYLAVRPGQRV